MRVSYNGGKAKYIVASIQIGNLPDKLKIVKFLQTG